MVLNKKALGLVLISNLIIMEEALAAQQKVLRDDIACYVNGNVVNCDNKQVVIDSDSDTSIAGNRYTEYMEQRQDSVSNNQVTMIAGKVKGNITGGYLNINVQGDKRILSADINGNRVEFVNGYLNESDSTKHGEGIVGGQLVVTLNGINQVNINDNSVNISEGTIYTHGNEIDNLGGVFGGSALVEVGSIDQFTMTGNQVSISDGVVYSDISAAIVANSPLSEFRQVALDNNRVKINGGHIVGNVAGASFWYQQGHFLDNASASMSNNQITISGGNITGNIIGSLLSFNQYTGGNFNNHLQLNNNQITINGGKIHGDIYGGLIRDKLNYGKIDSAAINNNIITLAGGRFDNDTRIFGGYVDGPIKANLDLLTGNTLNFAMSPIAIKQLGNFQYYNFYLNKEIKNGDTLITTNDANDLTGSEIKVIAIEKGSQLAHGDHVTLIDSITGDFDNIILNDSQVTIGTAKIANVSISLEPGNQRDSAQNVNAHILMETKKENPQTQSYLGSRLSAGLFLHQGSDIVADYLGRNSINHDDVAGFAILTTGHNRYKTEGNIDINGQHFFVGAAKNYNPITFGAFVEAGRGSYESHYQFDSLANVSATGDLSYNGGGLFAYYQSPVGLYIGAVAHAGHIDSHFNSHDFGIQGGVYSHYDSGSSYYAASIESGRRYEWSATTSSNIYARYLWTHLNRTDVSTDSDEHIHFDRQNLNNIKGGIQVSYKPGNIELMLGGAYGYDFSATPQATIDDSKINNGSIRGSIFMAETAGKVYLDHGRNLSAEISVQGYAGHRQGVNGLFNIQYLF